MTVVVTPATDEADLSSCHEGYVSFAARLLVSASDQAPAFYPAESEVSALVTQQARRAGEARVSFPIAAGYFSILDVSAQRTQAYAGAGGDVRFPLWVTNFGNGHTHVDFEVVTRPGLDAHAPAPILLMGRQAGASEVTASVLIFARRAADAIGSQPILVLWSSSYVLDHDLDGDSGLPSLLLLEGDEPHAPPEHPIAQVPADGVLASALALVVAVLIASRRGGQLLSSRAASR